MPYSPKVAARTSISRGVSAGSNRRMSTSSMECAYGNLSCPLQETTMTFNRFLPGLAVGLVLGGTVAAFAAAKTYQWTGEVTEVNKKQINVQKGDETWELAIDSDTKGDLDAKKGDKV